MSDDGWSIEWRKADAPSRREPGPPPAFPVEPLIEFLRARAADDAPPAGVTQLRPTPSGARVEMYVDVMARVAAVTEDGPPLDELKRSLARTAEQMYGAHPDFLDEWRLSSV